MSRLEQAQARLLRSLPLHPQASELGESDTALRDAANEAVRRIDALLDEAG